MAALITMQYNVGIRIILVVPHKVLYSYQDKINFE